MGLRCSVLGHRYGARERIEERNQEGDEVIVTVRDVKTCDRCGSERVVSESKEVTAAPGATPTSEETDEMVDPAPETNEEPVERPPAEGDDDGVILEDTAEPPEESNRGAGEWPDEPEPAAADAVEADGAAEPAADEKEAEENWPDVDIEGDEGYDAVTATADEPAVDELVEAATTAAEEQAEGEETETGFVKATAIESPADPSEGDVLTEYYCPRCGWQRESLDASVRAGDICPDCRIGYIAERDPA